MTENVEVNVEFPEPVPARLHVANDRTISDRELRAMYRDRIAENRERLERIALIGFVIACAVIVFTVGFVAGAR